MTLTDFPGGQAAGDAQAFLAVGDPNIHIGHHESGAQLSSAGVEQFSVNASGGAVGVALAVAGVDGIDLPAGQRELGSQSRNAVGDPNIHTGQGRHGTQTVPAGVEQSSPAPAKLLASPREDPPELANPNFPDGQCGDGTQSTSAVGEPNIHTGHGPLETQHANAGVEQSPPVQAKHEPTPTHAAPELADPLLALSADILDDLERVRIANENRLRQLTRTATDDDGEERGFGLPENHPDVVRLAALVDSLIKAEGQATKNLERRMKQHPLGEWVKRTKGVGEKQAARLLASIGDPYWNTLHDRPRLVSELWAYCGYHVEGGAAVTRQRGKQANWSADAKMRAYLVSVSCIKVASSPYRMVYDEARVKHAEATHQQECKRCGPAGKPAQPGSALSAGHQHMRAIRAMSKALLTDLWREARTIHGVTDEKGSGA